MLTDGTARHEKALVAERGGFRVLPSALPNDLVTGLSAERAGVTPGVTNAVNLRSETSAGIADDERREAVVALSYVLSYARAVAVVNFRTDARSEAALAELMSDGSSASEAIRQALVDAVRLRRRERMRAESEALLDDPADREESKRVLAAMDELRAW